MNIQFLKDNYLFGIPLQDIYGNQFQDSLLQHYIDAAIMYAQRMFQITINPVDIPDEVHDYYANDFLNWSYLQLYKRPVLEVSSISMWFGTQQMVEFPKDWIKITSVSGQLQLFPSSGSAGAMVLTQGGSFLPTILGLYNYSPQILHVTYKAGMPDLPDDLVEYIMKRATVGILQVWGDLIIGAGIANQTISIDGLSQSIGTTQSPEFSGAGARIKNYQDDMKILEKKLKDTYLGINMIVL
ncbi:MAG: hypothetical protein Q8910_00810 [Bacteroidota bacterium]|nr:hypothetical protein [Bacteroidota bacterium]